MFVLTTFCKVTAVCWRIWLIFQNVMILVFGKHYSLCWLWRHVVTVAKLRTPGNQLLNSTDSVDDVYTAWVTVMSPMGIHVDLKWALLMDCRIAQALVPRDTTCFSYRFQVLDTYIFFIPVIPVHLKTYLPQKFLRGRKLLLVGCDRWETQSLKTE